MTWLEDRLAQLDSAGWAALQHAVARLEDYWRTGAAVEIAHCLPDTDEPLRTTILVELIKEDQEQRWRRGVVRQIEQYLVDWPELGCKETVLIELLASECLTRASYAEAPTAAELQRRFPQLVDRIDLRRITTEARSETSRHAAHRQGRPLPPGPDRALTGAANTGRPFGHYRLHERIGKGAMGAVHRAFDTELQRYVALKFPVDETHTGDPAERVPPPDVAQRFLAEARAAASVSHANVCTVFEVNSADGIPYVAMQLVEGPRLNDWILTEGPIDEQRAARIVAKLAHALQALHNTGIVHRDVKSANVILTPGDEPVLTDFSLARPVEILHASRTAPAGTGHARTHDAREDEPPAASDNCCVPDAGAEPDTHWTRLAGTPAYMSPEQAAGGPIDERSDIYSLGVVFYHLLTARLPFDGNVGVEAVLRAVECDPPPSPSTFRPSLDRRLEAICLKAIAKDPAERFQTALEFRAALQPVLSPGTLRIPEARRRMRASFIATSLAAACLLVAALSLWRAGQGRPPASADSVLRHAAAESSSASTVTDPADGYLRWQLDNILLRLQDGRLPADPAHRDNADARGTVLHYMNHFRGHPESLRAARLLLELPWPEPAEASHAHILLDLTRGGASPPFLRIVPDRIFLVTGKIAPLCSCNTFSLWIEHPGVLLMEILSLDEGFRPLIRANWLEPDGTIASNTHGGHWDGVDHTSFPVNFPEGQHWMEFEVTGQGIERPSGPGRYMVILQHMAADRSRSGSDPGMRDRLERIERNIERLATGEPHDDETAGQRQQLVDVLRQPGKPPEVQRAAELLVRLPWPDLSAVHSGTQWGRFLDPRRPREQTPLHLRPGESLVLHERIDERQPRKTPDERPCNSFRLTLDCPGPVATRLVSLTPGFCAQLEQVWATAQSDVHGGAATRSDASAALLYRPALSCIERIADFHGHGVIFRVRASPHADAAPAADRRDTGEYLLYIWQPE